MTHWTNHAIWWHIYPLGFTNSPIHGSNHPPAHRLPQLINWLDYAVELGVNGLSLGPIFASETHGYDTVDHFQIDPRLGNIEDFQALITACTDRGVEFADDLVRGGTYHRLHRPRATRHSRWRFQPCRLTAP